MTTRAVLRKAASTFPEVEESSRAGAVVFSVRNKEFVSLTADGTVRLRLPAGDVGPAVERYADARPLTHAGRTIGAEIPLRDADGQHLWALVMAAWKYRAPKSLAAELDSITSGAATSGDLPPSIGKAATRALRTAELSTLAAVSARSEADLLALHGVGPKAVRILGEALAERGLAFAAES
ncbi:hypothetical protein IU433_00120 [Nocardia puris]|uniref:Helix-hairpin-helix protein n=1 Tax=Nocardia puris TaxID=208602 RepID=A0A366DU47_9NOCA|nr:hypothetical protein [Nocardia puris]MBF6210192.1 hypothetical protein [Nocardia puris]MBF6367269.1 hypothetical protein [Nocardia puris]MBF6457453.1 hypothetical protein [Nocardia puris]RBO93607.1 hypothetical protein DFR74_10223 [Nocardia puris]